MRLLVAVLLGLGLLAPVAAAQSAAGPPGGNDWNCRPSAQHPNPVVLVHGLGATAETNWVTVSPLLASRGYCVFALTYGQRPPFPQGGVIPMEQSAEQLAAFVDAVRAATGAAEVDLVGHSEGTLMPQYYLQFLGGVDEVERYVAVTPVYEGTLGILTPATSFGDALGVYGPLTDVFGVACGSCPQFVAGSDYLERMHAQPGGAAVPGVTYTTVMTRYDALVIPYTSGRLTAPNATNIVVQDGCESDFSGHASIITTPRTGQIILNGLDPSSAMSPPCGGGIPLRG
ncbi:MAG: lipase family protein [Actinomycetota bacterium]|nr:lipase family protein [Actinomycetota bacterium]